MTRHDPVTELRAVVTALLIFEALHATGAVRRARIAVVDVAWIGAVVAVAWFAHDAAFGERTYFLAVVAALLGVHVLRTAIGAIDADTRMLERWRYAFPIAYGALSNDAALTTGAILILALNRRDLRGLLLLVSRIRGPFGISPLEVDHLLPPRVTYERRRRREEGFTLLETVVALTLLATVSMAISTAAAGRALRLRQVRETAVVREAASSELARLGAVPFASLAAENGGEFAVPGDGAVGRVLVTFPEAGLARIVVRAPRRGAAPVELTTVRSEEAP